MDVYKLYFVWERWGENCVYYNIICGYKRIVLKKDRGNKIGL